MHDLPGPLILFGSGETSENGRKAFDWLFDRLKPPIRVAILETPAGFEPNSDRVAGRIGVFLRQRLQNYSLEINLVPARKRGTAYSPDDPKHAEQVLAADCIFIGPGSPTYAVRQLRESVLWDAVRVRHASGIPLVLASASVLAISRHTLPVYEIYKAGAELRWESGLDLLGPAGLSIAFLPHWNNQEGGRELDTSRCFMGEERFATLQKQLPRDSTVVGIDEHTALVLHPRENTGFVLGQGSATVQRSGETTRFRTGTSFPLSDFADLNWTALTHTSPASLVERAHELEHERDEAEQTSHVVPDEVLNLVEQRQAARGRREWAVADELRARIGQLGYQVQDTPHGPQVTPIPET